MRQILLAISLAVTTLLAQATDVSVVGLFPGKAVLVVDSGSPKTYSVGATILPGVKLIAANQSTATIDFNGKREVVAIGQHAGGSSAAGGSSVTLRADRGGHFLTDGQINGGTVRMVVDTGASNIALPASDAIRLGINYKSGRIGYVSTANGRNQVYNIKLDTVKVGDIVLHQVDAGVVEQGLPFILLGMSFLSRTEMQHSGDTMTLKKRF